MKKRIITWIWILSIITITIALTACGGKTIKPYTTPLAGEWTGEKGSFTLMENGEISNFSWVLNAKEFNAKCPISMNETLPVSEGVADLTFTNKNTGAVSFSIIITFTSENSAHLTYEYDFCPSTSSISFDESGKTRIFKGEAEFTRVSP